MKVLLVNTLYFPNVLGGAERSVQFIAENLVQNGHEPVVVCISDIQGINVKKHNSVKVYYVGLKNIYWPFKGNHNQFSKIWWHILDTYNPLMIKQMEKILVEENPDIVHTNCIAGFSAGIWPLIKKYDIPLIHTIRDYYMACPSSTMFNKGKNCEAPCKVCKVFSLIRKRKSEYVDSLVGISTFILNKHVKLGFFSNADKSIIFNAYENKGFGERNSGGSEKTISKNLRIGYFGRLHETKGVHLILNSLNKINSLDWSFKIAGHGDEGYISELKKMSNKQVQYLGFVRPEEFFTQVDVLVVPSLWHEPLGRIVFEAYSFGIPVIGSDRGGIPEIIDEGNTGFIFNPDQDNSLADKIKLFLEDENLNVRMRKFCLEKSSNFLPKPIMERYIQAYKNVVMH